MRFKLFILLLFGFIIGPALISAQNKGIKPLRESATLAETQKWLIDNLTKYATYKTRVNSASVSDVKFDGCSIAMTVVRKTAVAAQDVMGVTTRTHSSKQDIAFHLTFVEPDGVAVGDHIFPEFQVITIKFRAGDHTSDAQNDSREHEVIVKREAGDAIRDALLHARQLCTSK